MARSPDAQLAGASARILLGGETVTLLPGRAALRESTGELLVSDVHLGKDEAFRRAGRPLPAGETRAELAKLSALVAASGATGLTILGDLTHHQLDPDSETLQRLRAWLIDHARLEPKLVCGNHDRHAQDLVNELPLTLVAEPHGVQGLDYRHHPPEAAQERPWIAGHVHPGTVLDVRSDSMKLPIFWVQKNNGLVLPAFGDFTGLFLVSVDALDSAYAAGDTAVVRLPTKTRLS